MKKIYLALAIYFMFTVNAHAYLDPGTGSIIISAIVAGLLTIRAYWRNLIEKLKKIFSKRENKSEN
tara:strand:- start:593 stop:790 length:198 start_codon:yes stop_codon:yes gene_type:complete